jgi:energy-coupling factor transport system ATP-binding protein
VGIVLQNPETQLLTSSVGAEVAFGLENLCVEPGLMPARVRDAVSAVGLGRPLEFGAEKLSMGQKYRLIMASLLVMEPDLLVLDEPAAQLDPKGLERLVEVIVRLKATGVSFLLCEHHPEYLAEAIDRTWHLADGTLQPSDGIAAAAHGREIADGELPGVEPEETGVDREVVRARGLAVDGANGAPVWSDVSFSVGRGQRAAVCGPNGEGKTMLFRCLTGSVQPLRGEVQMLGERPDPERLRGRAGCLFQNPAKQLFEDTVFEEVAFTPRRLGTSGEDLTSAVEAALALCGIEDLAGRSPHKLSYGQRHLVALASILAPEPEVLLLDDPFAGLDRERCSAVLDLMHSLSKKRDRTVVWTTHNPRSLPDWVDLVLNARGGAVVPA